MSVMTKHLNKKVHALLPNGQFVDGTLIDYDDKRYEIQKEDKSIVIVSVLSTITTI